MTILRPRPGSPHRALAACLAAVAIFGGRAHGQSKTLEECLAIALENKPSLKAAASAVDAARFRVWQAASGYLPAVDATQQVERRRTSVGNTVGTDFASPLESVTIYSAGVGFSQMLFDFGTTLASIQAARAGQRSAAADQTVQRETVVLQVKRSYFDLLASQRLLAVAETTYAQNRKQMDAAEARHAVGMVPRFDVTRAGVQLANAELDRLTARNNVALARETLRDALGLGQPLDFEIADVLGVPAIAVDEQNAVAIAYANRAELVSLEEQRQALQQQVAALQRSFLPSVVGTGSYNWSGSESPLQDSWRVAAVISLPIASGGLTTAQLLEQKSRLAKLEHDIETQRQQLMLEVRRTALEVNRTRESITAAAFGERQARENYDVADGRYRGGVGTILELTDAQASLTSAEASHVRALYGHRIAIAALERALGTALGTETLR